MLKYCKHHGDTEFILEGRGYFRCRKCRSNNVQVRRTRVRRILVDEAGGECTKCGYNKCIAALQFHHTDPSTKSYALSCNGLTKGIDTLRQEAKKCILLCANCHAETEYC